MLGGVLLTAQFFGVFLPSCGSTAASRAEMTTGPDRAASGPLAMIEAMPYLAPGFGGPTPLEREERGGDGGEVFVSRYRIVEGESEGASLVIERGEAGDERWRLRTYVQPSDSTGSESQGRRLMQDEEVGLSEDGGAVLLESINHAEGVIVRITPALIVLPALLGAEEPFTQRAQMKLPLIANPSKLREHGTVVKTMRIVGLQRIEVGGESFECVRVHETHASSLSMARSERITESWYAPGVGLIARRYTEAVKALGVTVRSRRQTIEAMLP